MSDKEMKASVDKISWSDKKMKAGVDKIMEGFLTSAQNNKYQVSTPSAYEIKRLEQEKQRQEKKKICDASVAEHLKFAKFVLKTPTEGPKYSWSTLIPPMNDYQAALCFAVDKIGLILERKTYIVEIEQIEKECSPFYRRFVLTNTRNPYTLYPIFWDVSEEIPRSVKGIKQLREGKFKVTITDN